MAIPHVELLCILSILTLASGLGLLSCSEPDATCPLNSQCKQFDSKTQCLCNQGYQPSDDGIRCLEVVELDGDCSREGTACRRGPWGKAVCSGGTCTCPRSLGYRRTTGGRCTKDPITYEYALLGEQCNHLKRCWNARTQQCLDGKCVCKSDFKMAGENIRSAFPNSDECVDSRAFIQPA